MNPLFKVVAITLLTAHPDRFRQCLNVGASTNVKPPAGISLVQLIRSVEQRGANLLRQLIIQEELQQKQQNSRTGADGANSSNNNNNANNKNGNNNSNFDADDGELMNADGQNDFDEEDATDAEKAAHERRIAQQTGRIARFKQLWPQDALPQVWVPDVVRQLISMGAVVNENAAIENRRPHLRLTQAAFNAAFNELAGLRFDHGANSIVPTEMQRRTNKNKHERTKRKKTQQKKAKRAGDKKTVIMEKKLSKVRGKVFASKKKKSGAGKKRSK